MTRAERRKIARHATRYLIAGNRAPAHLTDNPNTGKRHAARMDTGGFDAVTGQRILTSAERRQLAARRDYRPLTVATPVRTKTGAHSRRNGRAIRMVAGKAYSQYTV